MLYHDIFCIDEQRPRRVVRFLVNKTWFLFTSSTLRVGDGEKISPILPIFIYLIYFYVLAWIMCFYCCWRFLRVWRCSKNFMKTLVLHGPSTASTILNNRPTPANNTTFLQITVSNFLKKKFQNKYKPRLPNTQSFLSRILSICWARG